MVKEAIFLVGHQYSGKSTWLASSPYKDAKIFSLDSVVHELASVKGISYSDAWKSCVGEASRILDERLEDWIDAGETIVFDRTNMTRKSRSRYLNKMRYAGYSVKSVVFPLLSSEEILKRIAMRPNQYIPLKTVEEFRDRFEPISGEEKKLYEQVVVLN